jgi:PII-like signaling protein
MKLEGEAKLLRIFIGEGDKWHHAPLYEAIVLKARELHMAGATVLRGPMGFGAHSRLHTTKILRLSEDLPFIIEIVTPRRRSNILLPHIDEMVEEGLVTLETVHVINTAPMQAPDERAPAGQCRSTHHLNARADDAQMGCGHESTRRETSRAFRLRTRSRDPLIIREEVLRPSHYLGYDRDDMGRYFWAGRPSSSPSHNSGERYT